MVRKYKRKRRPLWNETELKLALERIKNGQSISSIALDLGIPRSTLQRKFRNNESEIIKTGFKRVFTDEQEEALRLKIVYAQTRMQGLTSKELRRLAFDFAEKLNVPHKFNKVSKLAGKDWINSFMKRHKLSLGKAEHTSIARANGFNKEAVGRFFDLLEKIIIEKKIKPHNIWNVDETGISVNPKSTSRVIARQGVKQVGGLVSAERGENITAEICMSSAGKFMPPMLIFPRITYNKDYLQGALPGVWGEFNGTGWISEELFTKWFIAFIKFSQPSEEDVMLLTLDGHFSHIKNLEVIDLAMEHFIEMICFPPHCTHRMQPLDVSFMKPLSDYYTEAVNKEHSLGNKVTMKDVCRLFCKAWQKAAKIETAINAFEATGIVPFNRNKFKDSDFASLRRESLNETEVSPQVRQYLDVINSIENEENVSRASQLMTQNPNPSNSALVPAVNFIDTRTILTLPSDKQKEVIQKIADAHSYMSSFFSYLSSSFSGNNNQLFNTMSNSVSSHLNDSVCNEVSGLEISIPSRCSQANVSEKSQVSNSQPKEILQEISVNSKKPRKRTGQAEIITTPNYRESLATLKENINKKKEAKKIKGISDTKGKKTTKKTPTSGKNQKVQHTEIECEVLSQPQIVNQPQIVYVEPSNDFNVIDQPIFLQSNLFDQQILFSQDPSVQYVNIEQAPVFVQEEF